MGFYVFMDDLKVFFKLYSLNSRKSSQYKYNLFQNLFVFKNFRIINCTSFKVKYKTDRFINFRFLNKSSIRKTPELINPFSL